MHRPRSHLVYPSSMRNNKPQDFASAKTRLFLRGLQFYFQFGSVKMEKFSEIVEKVKKFYEKYLKYENRLRFDPEFKLMMEILYFFGWYHPEPTKHRKAYGVFMFSFVLLSFFFGCISYTISGIANDDLSTGLLTLCSSFIILSVMVLVATLALNQTKFTDHLEELKMQHEYYNDDKIKELSQKCCKLAKGFACMMIIVILVGCVMKAMGSGMFRLLIPAIYDHLAIDVLYYPMMLINLVHFVLLLTVVVLCDMLPIFCVARIVTNMRFLAHEIRNSTNSDRHEENEYELKACQRYYQEIRR
jgi:hypothetical protein